ncbi:MAG: DUF1080 domain-containing protein [Planctomycetaceae bacterium]|nr:DUF1080 domain-containing protein [Planctomycetaceae bacterium]
MLRLFLLLPFFLLPACQQAASPPVTLTPVAVDVAAAYPSQEPKTRPPILTGFTPLSKEQLDEGRVQLFDGISTFGWEVTEGKGTPTVMTDGEKNYLTFEKTKQGQAAISHRLCGVQTKYEDDGTYTGSAGNNWAIYWLAGLGDALSSILSDFPCQFIHGVQATPIYGVQAKPNNLQPLTESDWKPAAGKSEAKWTDGVLELTGGSGMVESVKEYGDFVLQLEYLTEKGINSGVFFRCIPGENMNGYECQIFNSPPDGDYEKFIGTDTGGIFRRQVGRNVGPKDGEWNYLTIAARGPNIATWVNGIQVTDWTDTREEHPNPRNGKRLAPGTIQLQGHDPSTKIQFRNFRIAEE